MTLLTREQRRVGGRMERIFEADVRAALGPRRRRVALCLSGGMDSTAVGMAAKSLGHDVHAYTFRLRGQDTFDSKWAERTARALDWDWTPVDLPTDVRDVAGQWRGMYDDLKCRKKREFECAWPFLHVYPSIQERHVLNGLRADMFFALSRRASKLGASGKNSNREAFDKMREDANRPYFERGEASLSMAYNPSCLMQHLLMQREHGLVDVNPWRGRAIHEFLMGYSWQELNLPKQKQFLRWMYPDWTALTGTRNHQNYQHAGNIDKHFELLLDTPVNYCNRGRTIDMFGDFWRPSCLPEVVWRQIDEYARPRPRR